MSTAPGIEPAQDASVQRAALRAAQAAERQQALRAPDLVGRNQAMQAMIAAERVRAAEDAADRDNELPSLESVEAYEAKLEVQLSDATSRKRWGQVVAIKREIANARATRARIERAGNGG